jgi:hypothetical protein
MTRLIHLELFTDFFNKIDPKQHYQRLAVWLTCAATPSPGAYQRS